MSESYFLMLSDGSFDQKVGANDVVIAHGLTFTGRGVTEYGEARNENILHIVENFANATPPSDPLTGQLWYDTNADALQVWDGSAWTGVTLDTHVLSGTYSVNNVTGEVLLSRSIGSDVVIQNVASQDNFSDHLSDTTAHPATAIEFSPTGSISSNNAQGAVEDVYDNINDHITDTTDAHDASAINFSSFGSITSPNIQLAIEEVKDEIDSITSQTNTHITNITNHINDTTDAHDADAISFDNSSTSLSATNVQDAIDEIEAGSGSAGALETIRVSPSSSQLIGTSFTQVNFQNVNLGNTSSQWNVGSSVYTAAFDQEVNIQFALTVSVSSDVNGGAMEIRVGGTSIRNHQLSNQKNDASGSDSSSTLSYQIGTKVRLTSGQQIRFFAFLSAGESPFVPHNTSFIGTGTFAEFEVVRIL